MALADLDDSPFGVNSHEQSDFLQVMAAHHVRWHRVDFKWSRVATNANQQNWDWSVPDAIVQAAEEIGASLLVVAAYTPKWASRQQDQHGLNDDQCDALPPTDSGGYVQYVEALVRRFAGRIHAISLWNEPNIHFWRGTRDQYMKMVVPALERVRKLAPDLVTAGPDVSTWPDKDSKEWLNALLGAGIPQRFYDVITHHQYGADRDDTVKSRLGRIDDLHNFLRSHGLGDKQLWITEIGWDHPRFPRDRQVESMRELMRAMKQRSAWWKKTFWYDSHGYAVENGKVKDWGLIGGPNAPDPGVVRAALPAYREVISAEGIVPPIGIAQARDTVKKLYRAVLRRTEEEIEHDPDGVENNTRTFQKTSLGVVVDGFIRSPEFPQRWSGVSSTDIARMILENLPGAPTDGNAIAQLAAQIESREAGRRIAQLIDPVRTA